MSLLFSVLFMNSMFIDNKVFFLFNLDYIFMEFITNICIMQKKHKLIRPNEKSSKKNFVNLAFIKAITMSITLFN